MWVTTKNFLKIRIIATCNFLKKIGYFFHPKDIEVIEIGSYSF